MYDPDRPSPTPPTPAEIDAAMKARAARAVEFMRHMIAVGARHHIQAMRYYRVAAGVAVEYASQFPELAEAVRSIGGDLDALPNLCREAVRQGWIDPADPLLAGIEF